MTRFEFSPGIFCGSCPQAVGKIINLVRRNDLHALFLPGIEDGRSVRGEGARQLI
jgi:hypothetical protein